MRILFNKYFDCKFNSVEIKADKEHISINKILKERKEMKDYEQKNE